MADSRCSCRLPPPKIDPNDSAYEPAARAILHYWTVTLPDMAAPCTVQWYGYEPAVLNVLL